MQTVPHDHQTGTSPFFLSLVEELLQVPTERLIDHVIARVTAHFGARHACVHLTDGYLAHAFHGCMHRCPTGDAPPQDRQRLMLAEETWRQCTAATGQAFSLVEASEAAPPSRLLAAYFRLTDGLSVPLLYQGDFLGTLNLYLQSGSLTAGDRQALSGLGGIIYALVKRTRMLRSLQDRDDVIHALARAVEAKDPYTGQHLERVSMYAGNLARALALPEEEVEATERAALLHDIGKIGVPDAVLAKPGFLTLEERQAMERHPVIAAEIFQGVRDIALRRALPGMIWHHERPDGHGYPDRLAGDEIPMIARIIAVADSYDAMTSDRPYRKGLEPEAALEILQAQAGKQFDPAVVECFIRQKCYGQPHGGTCMTAGRTPVLDGADPAAQIECGAPTGQDQYWRERSFGQDSRMASLLKRVVRIFN